MNICLMNINHNIKKGKSYATLFDFMCILMGLINMKRWKNFEQIQLLPQHLLLKLEKLKIYHAALVCFKILINS